jgi:hypothetical protein
LGDDLTRSLEQYRNRPGQATERGGIQMRIVIALGGNALLMRGEPMTTDAQRRNIRIAARAIAPLAAGHSIVVVHGNGPQVGLLSLQAESYAGATPYRWTSWTRAPRA